MNKFKLSKKLCEAFGVSGCEDEVRDIIKSVMTPLCDSVETDRIGNLICFKKGTSSSSENIMLAAHMDEVGFIITGITKEGYLRFRAVGGIDPRVVIAKRVCVGDKRINGVIGDKPPHLGKSDAAPKMRDLYIDIGAKNETEASKHTAIGDYVCFERKFVQFGGAALVSAALVSAKALDDRIGCFILTELAKNRYPNDVYYTFTVQEEIGCRGAAIAAHNIMPNVAIVVEGTTCSDVPGTEKSAQVTKLGGGAALSIVDRSSYADITLRKALYNTAVSNNIPVQYKQTMMGGNDSGAIHLAKTGIRTAVISVPCRYIHSPSSVASIADIEACTNILDRFMANEEEKA